MKHAEAEHSQVSQTSFNSSVLPRKRLFTDRSETESVFNRKFDAQIPQIQPSNNLSQESS